MLKLPIRQQMEASASHERAPVVGSDQTRREVVEEAESSRAVDGYADASGAGNDVYEFVKAIGKFKETKRTDGISTSDVIMRILKDYNQYVMRNLARGYTRKDLGVSYVKEKQLRVNMGITKLRQKVKEHQEKFHTVAKTAGIVHNEWLENADRWVAGFLEKFEEGCHIMETAIKDRIQERWRPKSLPQEQLVS